MKTYLQRLADQRKEGATTEQDKLQSEENQIQLQSDALALKKELGQMKRELEKLCVAKEINSNAILNCQDGIEKIVKDQESLAKLQAGLFPDFKI